MKRTTGNILLLIIFVVYLLGAKNYCFQEDVWMEKEQHQKEQFFSAINLPPVVNLNEKDSRNGTTFRIDFYHTPIFGSNFKLQSVQRFCETTLTDYSIDFRFPIYIWVDCFLI